MGDSKLKPARPSLRLIKGPHDTGHVDSSDALPEPITAKEPKGQLAKQLTSFADDLDREIQRILAL